MRKHLSMILGIMAILFLVVCVSACISSDSGNNKQSTSTSGSSSSSGVSDVIVVVSYSGDYAGEVTSSTGSSSTIMGSGKQTFDMGAITSGDVVANVEKIDSGTGTLTVSIVSGGKTLATKSTSAKNGKVQVSTSM